MTTEAAFKIKIVRRIDEVSPQEWIRAFPNVVENYYFFKTLDESNLTQFEFFYILIYDKGTLVGATNGFVMDFPLDIAVTGKFKIVTNFLSGIFPRVLNPKILICGLPMGQGRIGICTDPQGVIQAICKGMEELACAEKAGIIAFKDFDSGYNKILGSYLDKGFFKVESLPSTEMEINFKSFSEYMMKLGSVSRSGLKRKFKEIDGKVKIDLEITNKLEEGLLNDVYALYLQTYDKQEMGLEKLSIDFFRNISSNMSRETKFFLWRIDNKLVAFAFCLVGGDYFIDYYLGFDYAVAFKYHLYFVRFRDLMNWCIENRMKKYEMGATGYEPKRRLGFDLIPLFIYVKHRNKLLNLVFKAFCRIIQPSNFQQVLKGPE